MKYIALIAFHFGNVLFFIFSAFVGIFFLLAISSDPLVSLFFLIMIPIWMVYTKILTQIKTAPHDNARIRYQFQAALIAWGSIFLVFGGCIYLIDFSAR